MRWGMVTVVFTLLVVGGCPRIQDEHFSCPDGRCPSGYVCHPDAVCRRASVGDAGLDAPSPEDAGGDATSPADAGFDAADAGPPAPPPVDLLFLVDTSASMVTAQEQLRAAFPDFIIALATGRFPGDATPTFPPLTDIHVGVITPYMGTGGVNGLPTCLEEPDFGHDGVLRTASADPTCPSDLPKWLAYDGTSTSTFERNFACKANLGTDGCGFEQQLEAVAKAITPSTATTRFYMDTPGQADRGNAGFFRDGAVLVIVLVSDEDDCSVSDPDFFNPASAVYTEDLNLRCIHHAEIQEDSGADRPLHPIRRYADVLDDLGRPVVFAPLVGMPEGLEEASFDTILGDPRMAYETDGPGSTAPRNVCESDGIRASAGRRYLRVGAQLERASSGVRFVQGSICSDDYRGFAQRVTSAIFELATLPDG